MVMRMGGSGAITTGPAEKPTPEQLEKATPIQRQLLGDVKTSLGYILPQEEDVPLKAWMEKRGVAAAASTGGMNI